MKYSKQLFVKKEVEMKERIVKYIIYHHESWINLSSSVPSFPHLHNTRNNISLKHLFSEQVKLWALPKDDWLGPGMIIMKIFIIIITFITCYTVTCHNIVNWSLYLTPHLCDCRLQEQMAGEGGLAPKISQEIAEV